MSGITGVWYLGGAPVNGSDLSRMDAALGHRGRDGRGARMAGPVGFAHRHLWVTPEEVGEEQPLLGAGHAMLVFDGRLDNRDELQRTLDLPASASDAVFVLSAYGRWGEEFPARLTGDFALALHDPRTQRLLLARDAIGIRPLYYFHGNGIFAFGSEIKALLAHPLIPAKADDEGLADFMMIGARPVVRQDITCFAGIRAVVPAHVVVVTPDTVHTRRYWDFDAGRTLRLGSFEEYAEGFREVFARAVVRRVRSAFPVAIAVSGGLDSSSIFCQAERSRRDGTADCPSIRGISYTGAQGTEADERRYLGDIEREYDVGIDRFPMDHFSGVATGIEEQIHAIEAPFLDYQWGVTREFGRRASEAGARVQVSGHWGDQVLFSPAYLVDLVVRGSWGQAGRHLREYRRWFGSEEVQILRRRLPVDVLRHLVPQALVRPLKWARRRLFGIERPKPWFSDSFLKEGLRFVDRPAMLGEGFHSAQARSLYLEARSKYHVQCMEWNNKIGALNGVDESFPFLDRDLIAFLMAIPGEMQNHDGVPRAILREAMRGVLPEAVRQRMWKADFTAATNQGVARDLPGITRSLSADCLGVRLGYLDASRLAPALARLASGLAGPDSSDSWDLVDLFGLEEWLQVFLGGGGNALSPHSFSREEVGA